MSWWVLLLTLVPFLELRVSIPSAIAAGVPLSVSLPAAIVLNLLVIPLAFLLLDLVVPPLRRRFAAVDRLYGWSVTRVSRHERAGLLGLLLLVAVPLPGTGAYSGCLLAHILGMRRLPASLAISAGVIIAAVLVATVSWLSFSIV